MAAYKLNPYATFVESHLTTPSQYAVFHRVTGNLVEIDPGLRALLLRVKPELPFFFEPADVSRFGAAGRRVQWLVDSELLIGTDVDPLASLVDLRVIKPLQNPAVRYRREDGKLMLVRLSMEERVYSPAPSQLPVIIEEELPPAAAKLWLAADGTRTLRQIQAEVGSPDHPLESDNEFRDALDFLTGFAFQLIKLAPPRADLGNPFLPFNTVPRNFYHAAKWPEKSAEGPAPTNEEIKDFHRHGIDDASWEFDLLEPTINHALRFPSQVLGGLDYGSRFCRAVLSSVIKNNPRPGKIDVLEVGGGTGTFARSFITEAKQSVDLTYRILDLSPTLIAAQNSNLTQVGASVEHFEQDATQFELAGQTLDLIVANEVIADFPVMLVDRNTEGESGEGANLVRKYQLSTEDAPDRFYVNSGVFQFLERAWLHVKPGGAVVLSEYGSDSVYPAESFHLNHSEFSIQFRHVSECAKRIGFESSLQKLADFLSIDDNVSVLNGREEHLMCLRRPLGEFGIELPFALFSEADFKANYAAAISRHDLQPVRFLPIKSNFYYGAELNQFWVLILKKPST